MKGVLFDNGGDPIGYAYFSATGHVGPLAVAQAGGMGAAFRTALYLAAAAGAAQVSAFLPGVSESLGRARHADYITDGAGVDARFRRLAPVSPTKSGFYVITRH